MSTSYFDNPTKNIQTKKATQKLALKHLSGLGCIMSNSTYALLSIWIPLSLCVCQDKKESCFQHSCTFLEREKKTHFQVAPSSCATCPGGFDGASGSKHYYAVTSPRKWHEAEAACPPGTELASFKSTQEYDTFGDVFGAKREHYLESSFFFQFV